MYFIQAHRMFLPWRKEIFTAPRADAATYWRAAVTWSLLHGVDINRVQITKLRIVVSFEHENRHVEIGQAWLVESLPPTLLLIPLKLAERDWKSIGEGLQRQMARDPNVILLY
ncbi:MAG: hypothetical protein ACR2RL_15495 [Gammaproteobacteria bacterium]